jgi:hypothetical protein
MYTGVSEEHTVIIFRVKEGANQVARKKRAASRVLKKEAVSSFTVDFCWTCHYILEVINVKFQSFANILKSSDADDVELSKTSSCGIPNTYF